MTDDETDIGDFIGCRLRGWIGGSEKKRKEKILK
jgi:hypothetical protein